MERSEKGFWAGAVALGGSLLTAVPSGAESKDCCDSRQVRQTTFASPAEAGVVQPRVDGGPDLLACI